MQLPTVLVISGLDPYNLAGYGSDIRVMSKIGIHPVGVITAITSQIPGKLSGILPVDAKFLRKQLKLLFLHGSFEAVKIGMVYNKQIIKTVSDFLSKSQKTIIIDPIIKATAGPHLLKSDALSFYIKHLFLKSSLITPNIPEAKELLNMKTKITSKNLCRTFFDKFQKPVLLKGGHGIYKKKMVQDIFYNGKDYIKWDKRVYEGIDTHGSGCMLSSAITAYCAQGYPLITAIDKAQQFIKKSFKKPVNIHKKKYLSHYI